MAVGTALVTASAAQGADVVYKSFAFSEEPGFAGDVRSWRAVDGSSSAWLINLDFLAGVLPASTFVY